MINFIDNSKTKQVSCVEFGLFKKEKKGGGVKIFFSLFKVKMSTINTKQPGPGRTGVPCAPFSNFIKASQVSQSVVSNS